MGSLTQIDVKKTGAAPADEKLEGSSSTTSSSEEDTASAIEPDPESESKNGSTSSKSSSALEIISSYLRSSWAPPEKEPKKMIVRPPICNIPMKDITRFSISMSGCGFLGSYHFGAAACLVRHGKKLLRQTERFSGASAGSLVASMLVLAPNRIQDGLSILYDMADELNSLKFGALTPGFYLNERLVKIVDAHLPKDISKAQDKLVISLTDYKTRKNVLISKFPSREYLINCLLASCYIPMYSMGYNAEPPIIDGRHYIDGGYTNNLPDFEDVRTVTISPFSGGAEISPEDASIFFEWSMSLGSQQMNVNLQNIVRGAQALFPPNRQILKEYYRKGYDDTFRFLYKINKLHPPTQAVVFP